MGDVHRQRIVVGVQALIGRFPEVLIRVDLVSGLDLVLVEACVALVITRVALLQGLLLLVYADTAVLVLPNGEVVSPFC